LILTIAPSVTSSTTKTACNSFTWNGTTYSSSGTYTFNTTTAAGCDSVATLNLTISPPGSSFTTITACSSYTWNGQTYTTGGTYTFTSQTAGGCDSTATLNLTIAPKIATNFIGLDTSYCQQIGASIALQGNPAGGIFKINSNQANQLSLGIPGIYKIKYELVGCFDSSAVRLRIKPKATTSITGLDTAYCQSNQPITLVGSPSGGFFTGQGINGNIFTPSSIGTFTIKYQASGCSDTTKRKISIKTTPVASISSSLNAFCQDTSAIPLILNPIGGRLILNGIPVQKFRPQTPGINQLIYQVRTANCQSSDTILLKVDTKPVVSLTTFGTSTICGFDTLIPLYVSPPGGFYNTTAVVDSALNPKLLAPGNQRVTYYALNGVCKDSASKIFNILPVPLVRTGPIDTICYLGPTFNLSGFSPSGGVWSGANVSSTGSFNPIRTGFNELFYKIPPQQGFSCAGKASKFIFVTPKPKINFPNDTTVCEGSSMQLNPLYNRALAWKWQDGRTDPFIFASEVGAYYVELKDKFCTWNSDTFTVKKKIPLPVFSLGRDSVACFNYPAYIKGPSNMAKYEWSYIDSNTVLSRDSVFEMKDPSAIKLTVKSKEGQCYFIDDLVLIEKQCDEIHMPQAFSPNGDGENDYWKVFGVNAERISVKIFNEWGECVYSSTDLEDKWDGTYNGKMCNPGAYQCIVDYSGITPRGRKFKDQKNGVVYLVK
jgi:gliding motility-associated-like protein